MKSQDLESGFGNPDFFSFHLGVIWVLPLPASLKVLPPFDTG